MCMFILSLQLKNLLRVVILKNTRHAYNVVFKIPVEDIGRFVRLVDERELPQIQGYDWCILHKADSKVPAGHSRASDAEALVRCIFMCVFVVFCHARLFRQPGGER